MTVRLLASLYTNLKKCICEITFYFQSLVEETQFYFSSHAEEAQFYFESHTEEIISGELFEDENYLS